MDPNIVDRYKCKKSDYLTNSCSQILKHYQYSHSHEPGFQISCCVQNCPKTYLSVRTLTAHLKKKHPTFANEHLSQNDSSQEFSHCQIDQQVDMEIDQQVPAEPTLEPIQYDYDQQVGLFLLNLKERGRVQQVALTSLSAETKSLIEMNNAQLVRQFEIAMEKSRETGEEVDFNYLLSQQNAAAAGAFERLSTGYKLKSFCRKRLNMNEPIEIILGYSDNGKPETMQYISVIKTLQDLLSHEDVIAQVLRGHKSPNHLLKDFCDGKLYAKNRLFSEDDTALQILLYIDEFTVSNPLGYRVAKYKITAIYFLLGNLEPKFRSKLDLIQMAALARSMHVKKYGLLSLLEPLIEDIKVLETDGIQATFEGRKLTFRGTCSLCSADNLGAHGIGMHPENFSTSLRLCRKCMVTKDQLSTSFRETFPLRTVEGYNEQAAAVAKHPELASVYGVKGKSPLCNLEYYHVIDGLPYCIAHDLFEGVVPDILEQVVGNLISDGYLTLVDLQKCVNNFPYSDADKANKVSILSVKKLKLRFTQSHMWCFVRLLPLMVGSKVPEDTEYWSLVGDLLDILDHVCSPCLDEMHILYLESLVSDFLTSVVKIYPDDIKIKPKFHYMVHYGSEIRKFGPLKHCSTQRFESKHDESKQHVYRSKNRKNICKSMAEHHQSRQALIHTSPLLLGEGRYTVTGVESVHIRLYERVVQSLVEPYLQGFEIVPECKKVKVEGVQYSINSAVILGKTIDEYQFGVIRHIFIFDEKAYLCTELLDVMEYSTHYHAYKVAESGYMKLVQVPKLLDYHPLGLYKVGGSDYITLRYHIAT